MSIKKMDLEFDKLNLITGANGQGKSTIFDAISLCLTKNKRSTSFSEYVKQGEEFAKIILDCEINSEPVHFDIQINLVKGGTFDIDLTYKNKVYHNKETEDVIESFGLNYYSNLIFTLQREQDITTLTPSERAYYLQKLLNFDFEEQKLKLKKDIEQFNDFIKANNVEIPLKQKLIVNEQNSMEDLKQITDTKETIELVKRTIEQKTKELADAEKKLNNLKDLNNKVSEFNNKIFEKQKAVDKDRTMITSIQEQISKASVIDSNIENLKTKEIDVKSALEKINKTETEECQLNAEISAEQLDLKNNYAYLSKLKTELERLDKLYNEDKCPVCGQQTKDAAENQYINYIKSLNFPPDLIGNTESLQLCLVETNDKLKNFSNLLLKKEEELKDSNNKLHILSTNKSKNEAELDKCKSQISFYIEQKNEKTFTQEDIDNITKRIEENKGIISSLGASRISIEEQIKQFSDVKVSEISKEINLLNNQVTAYDNAIKTNGEIEIRNEKRKANIESLTKEIEALNTRTIEITQQKDSYEEAYKIFDKDLPNYMSIKACHTLQENINDFIQNIFPTYEISLQASKKGCEFFYTKDKSITETKKKNNFLINSKMSSGGEKDLLTMAFKVSLAKIYGCDCLFLDEADSQIDEDNSSELFEEVINEFNQMFIITHKKDLIQHLVNDFNAKLFEVKDGMLA